MKTMARRRPQVAMQDLDDVCKEEMGGWLGGRGGGEVGAGTRATDQSVRWP